MASPIPGLDRRTATRANWLGRYLSVERGFDEEIKKVLAGAAVDTEKRLVSLVGDERIGSKTRRLQLSQARNQLRGTMTGLFGEVTGLIKHFRSHAAGEAAKAAMIDEMPLLRKYFGNKSDADAYQRSMVQSANRNVEATLTRVLGYSKMPLSKRVYKTEALSKGLVDTAINNALSRGDSARDLAKAVAKLIDPNVPGGVSYAAMRLGRTEINNAFHAQSIKDAEDKPWVQSMTWHLSKVHEPQGCLCEVYAQQGKFPLGHVPAKPHPQCRCYVTPDQQDYDSFEQSLLGGQYDSYLDSILDAAGAGGSDMLPPKPASAPKPVERPLHEVTKEKIEKAQSIRAIREALEGYKSTVNWDDFNDHNFAVTSAKEIATTFVNLFEKHPEGLRTLRRVEVWDDIMMDSAYAHVQPYRGGGADMRLNRKFTASYQTMRDSKENGSIKKWTTKGAGKKPWEATITHEYGHVLDWFAGEAAARKKLFNPIKKVYMEESGEPKFMLSKFVRWLSGDRFAYTYNGHGPSRYAVHNPTDKGYNEAEIIAESFTDVTRNGDDAKPVSKAVYKVLMREVKAYK